MAAKRSRDARRMKENQIALRAGFLEKEVSSSNCRTTRLNFIRRLFLIRFLYTARYQFSKTSMAYMFVFSFHSVWGNAEHGPPPGARSVKEREHAAARQAQQVHGRLTGGPSEWTFRR